MTVINAESSQ